MTISLESECLSFFLFFRSRSERSRLLFRSRSRSRSLSLFLFSLSRDLLLFFAFFVCCCSVSLRAWYLFVILFCNNRTLAIAWLILTGFVMMFDFEGCGFKIAFFAGPIFIGRSNKK